MEPLVTCILRGIWGRSSDASLRSGGEKVLAALSADSSHQAQCVELAVLLFFHEECLRWSGQDENLDRSEVEMLTDYVREIVVDEVIAFRSTAEAVQWLQQTPLHPVDFFKKCHKSPSILTTLLLPILHHDARVAALLTHLIEPPSPEGPLNALFENPYCGTTLSRDIMSSLLQARDPALRELLALDKSVRYWAARLWYPVVEEEPGGVTQKRSLYEEAYACIERNSLVECIGCAGEEHTEALREILFDHNDDDVTASLCAFLALPCPTASLRHLCSLTNTPDMAYNVRPININSLLLLLEGIVTYATPGLFDAFAEALEVEGTSGPVWNVLAKITLSPETIIGILERVGSREMKNSLQMLLDEIETEAVEEEEDEEEESPHHTPSPTQTAPPRTASPTKSASTDTYSSSSSSSSSSAHTTKDTQSKLSAKGNADSQKSSIEREVKKTKDANPKPTEANSNATSSGTLRSSVESSAEVQGVLPIRSMLGPVTEMSCDKHKTRMESAMNERRMCRSALPLPRALEKSASLMNTNTISTIALPTSKRAASATLGSVSRLRKGRDRHLQAISDRDDVWSRKAAFRRGISEHRRHQAFLKADTERKLIKKKFESIVRRREARIVEEIAEWQCSEGAVRKAPRIQSHTVKRIMMSETKKTKPPDQELITSKGRQLTLGEMTASAERLHKTPPRPDFDARCEHDPNYIVGDALAQQYYPRRNPSYLKDEPGLVKRMLKQKKPKKEVTERYAAIATDEGVERTGERLSRSVEDHEVVEERRLRAQEARLHNACGEAPRPLEKVQNKMLLERLQTPLNRDTMSRTHVYYATDEGVFDADTNQRIEFRENLQLYRSRSSASRKIRNSGKPPRKEKAKTESK